jgi:hypothetical protein
MDLKTTRTRVRDMPPAVALVDAAGAGNRSRMASLEDRAWSMVLTSKMLTCAYRVTDDRINRD